MFLITGNSSFKEVPFFKILEQGLLHHLFITHIVQAYIIQMNVGYPGKEL